MISYHLPEFCIVRLQGKDVSTWLHRLVTTHVKAMPTHHSAWSYLLDAKGKIQFAFEIICYDPHKDNGQMNDSSPIYDCIIECAHADAFMQQLDHFLFTEDVKIQRLTHQCIRIIDHEQIESTHTATQQTANKIWTFVYQKLAVSIQDHIPPQLNTHVSTDGDESHIQRLSHQNPSFEMRRSAQKTYLYCDQAILFYSNVRSKRSVHVNAPAQFSHAEWDLWLPVEQIEKLIRLNSNQECTLYDLASYHSLHTYWGLASHTLYYAQPAYSAIDFGTHGIDDNKGCYPGQEVVERSIALGRAARSCISLHTQVACSVFETYIQQLLNESEHETLPQANLTRYTEDQPWWNVLNSNTSYSSIQQVHYLSHMHSPLYASVAHTVGDDDDQSKQHTTTQKPIGHLDSIVAVFHQDFVALHALAMIKNKKDPVVHFYTPSLSISWHRSFISISSDS